MSRSLPPCSAVGTKRARKDDHIPLVPCLVVCTKRVRGESAEGSSDSMGSPMSSSASVFSLIDLPDALLLEILLRLPIKFAFRCKSLCKRWCALISSYYSSTPSHTIMFQHEKYVKVRSRLFQIISDHPSLWKACKNYNFDFSFLPFFPRRTDEGGYKKKDFQSILSFNKLEATCDNLLLCSYAGNREDVSLPSSVINHYICNLVSKQYLELPPAPAPSKIYKKDDVGFLCEEKGMGVPCPVKSGGSCSSLALSRYVVVRIACIGYQDILSEFEVLIFSSETGCWNKSVIKTYPRVLSRFVPGSRLLAYKDKLHWLLGGCIVVFDPFKDREKFSRIIDLPMIRSKARGLLGFGVSGNRLRVAWLTWLEDGNDDPDDPALHIWELQDYDRGSWCLAVKISLIDIIGEYTPRVVNKEDRNLTCFPHSYGVFAFHPHDRDIVYLKVGQRVVPCNIRTRTEGRSYQLRKLDPLFYNNQPVLYWQTALQLVHRWSISPGGGKD